MSKLSSPMRLLNLFKNEEALSTAFQKHQVKVMENDLVARQSHSQLSVGTKRVLTDFRNGLTRLGQKLSEGLTTIQLCPCISFQHLKTTGQVLYIQPSM